MAEKEVYAVFFDPLPGEDELPWCDDLLRPEGIVNDRLYGGDTATGCWVRNWRLVDRGN